MFFCFLMQTPELLYKHRHHLFKYLGHPVIFHLNVRTNRPSSAISSYASHVLLRRVVLVVTLKWTLKMNKGF